MPDIILDPSAVVPGDGAQLSSGIAGVALTPGDVVALDGPTQRYVLATSATLAGARVRGIASCTAAPGQPVRVQTGGVLNLGSALLAVGELYALSGANPGKIAPASELAVGDVVSVLGIAQSTSLLQIRLWNSDIAKA